LGFDAADATHLGAGDGRDDPGIADLLGETLDLLQNGLEVSLEQAQAQGELPADKSPRGLAQVLTNSMLGMVVSGKLNRGPAALREIYDGTLAMLG